VNTCCIAVIGHVDHGKSALVCALTGIETDRLPEEKARGLSITPGYAYAHYSSGVVDFIDVPGHEDFIAAMVSGASGARAAMVVISAVEGIRTQTREHLEIAAALGIEVAIVAVTKADLLAQDARELRLEAIRLALSESGFGDPRTMLCSALTGEGLPELHAELETLLVAPERAAGPLHAFLPIDRVFSLAGRGTIVTGTLLGAEISADRRMRILPEGHGVTLRGLQSRGGERDRVQPGERVAVNLRGVAVGQIRRGAVLCAPDAFAQSVCMDVVLDVKGGSGTALKQGEEVRVLLGTASDVAQVRHFATGTDSGDQSVFAQLRFRKPVVGFAGQRAVLRRLSPSQTLGGAIVLDPQARFARANDLARRGVLAAVLRQDAYCIARALAKAHGGAFYIEDFARLARLNEPDASAALEESFVSVGSDMFASREDIESCTVAIIEALRRYHAANPMAMAAPRSVLSRLKAPAALVWHAEAAALADDLLRADGTHLALRDHDPFALLTPDRLALLERIEKTALEAGLGPPQDGADNDLLTLLIDSGRLVALPNVSLGQTLVFHRDALSAAAQRLCAAFPAPEPFTTSQARGALNTTRRIIVPVLEYFDARGITRRSGDTREMAADFPVPPLRAT
jgi:selenocysteine-specific elongation factor